MGQITFEQKAVVIQEQVTTTVTSVNLDFIIDQQEQKKVLAVVSIEGRRKEIILWEGDAYDTIGDWTQAQAEARIIVLL